MRECRTDPIELTVPSRQGESGLSGFFVSSEAARRGDVDLVRKSIVEKGFEILLELQIGPDRQHCVTDWLKDRGRDEGSGDIAAVFIAHDLLPIACSVADESAEASRRNERNAIATAAAVKEVNRLCPEHQSYVPVRATEDGDDAWSLLAALVPDRVEAIREEIIARFAAFATPPPLRELSSVACRAKVELVEYEGGLAVRKTFRPGAERYLERELEVLHQLGPHCEAIPKLLEHGRDFLIMEYVDEADQLDLPGGERLLPLQHVRELAQFVRTCVSHGFDPVDLKPDGNAIYTRRGLKIIDYEFWRRCPVNTRPEDCYCLAGLPHDYIGDRPMGLSAPFNPYPAKWIVFTGLSVRSFLYDPAWLQRLKRAGWPVVAAVRRLARSAARVVRRASRSAQSARRSA